MALVMGEIGSRSPLGPLLRDRAMESVLGALVAFVFLFLVPDPKPTPVPVDRL